MHGETNKLKLTSLFSPLSLCNLNIKTNVKGTYEKGKRQIQDCSITEYLVFLIRNMNLHSLFSFSLLK